MLQIDTTEHITENKTWTRLRSLHFVNHEAIETWWVRIVHQFSFPQMVKDQKHLFLLYFHLAGKMKKFCDMYHINSDRQCNY